jgi:SAM-dependent methyltransferase
MLDGKRSVNPNERTRRHVAGALGYLDPAYLEGTVQLLRVLKEVGYDWMQLERGYRVLDLGCGPGTGMRAGGAGRSDGMVVGIDRDPATLKETERRAREARLREPGSRTATLTIAAGRKLIPLGFDRGVRVLDGDRHHPTGAGRWSVVRRLTLIACVLVGMMPQYRSRIE